MDTTQNPFSPLYEKIDELTDKVNFLINRPKEDLSNKLYTIREASGILKVDTQTIRNHIERGNISATRIGRRILIKHSELYDSLNEVKSIKYKR